MMHASPERFLLSILVVITFAVASKIFVVMNRWSVRSRVKGGGMRAELAGGTPTLLYFWTKTCAQCGPQERQIEQARILLARSGKPFEVRKINAFEEGELVRSMNVMTVPTTVLLDAGGQVVAWNAGLRPAENLVAQFREVL